MASSESHRRSLSQRERGRERWRERTREREARLVPTIAIAERERERERERKNARERGTLGADDRYRIRRLVAEREAGARFGMQQLQGDSCAPEKVCERIWLFGRSDYML